MSLNKTPDEPQELPLRSVKEQRPLEELLEERLRFETLLSDLAGSLLSSHPSELHAQIGLWLERVVETLRIDRSSIFEVDPDGDKIELTHTYARAESGAPIPDPCELTGLPWYTQKIRDGERLVWTDLPASLPEWATAERTYCQERGLTAHLAIPLKISGALIGTLAINAFKPGHVWPVPLIQRLELLGQIFANALHRHRTEIVLKRSETRLQLALDAASVGIWEWDALTDRILWSQEAAAIHGHALSETPRTREAYALILHPDDRQAFQQRVEDSLLGKTAAYRSEHRALGTDGSLHWVEARGRLLRDEAGRPLRMIGTVADITERKRVEEEVRESHRMYQALVDSIDGIVWEADAATLEFTYVSPQAERILGYPTARWLSEPHFWTSHIHQSDVAWATEFCGRAAREERDHAFQYRMLAADGRTVWLHDVVSVVVEEGQPSKLRGVMVDITERKKIEEALRESESQFRTVFEEAPIGLAYVDPSFRLVRVNRALCEFLRYSAEELLTRSFVDITYPDDIERDAELATRTFNGEIPGYRIEKRYLRKDGEIVWGLLSVTLIRDRDGSVRSVLGMVENITGRKEAEDQLRHSQKMEALGRLAGGVAHDFNNLLTAIRGYSEITLAELPKDHSLRANLEEIIQAGDRATVLTRQLLAFGRKQVRRPKILDLRSTVDEMQRMLRRLIGENIKLSTTVGSKLGTVLADPSQVEQIIVNLVVNARDAMPRGGRLTIELEDVHLDHEYARYHPEVTPGPYVMLAVSDTGIGMSREVQQRIFEPFFTTKEPGMGTGLGLPTVYGIVKQSEGHIWVYSEEAIGTTFKIYLPSVGETPVPREPAPDVGEEPGGNESILLVEDDDSVRNMILRILREKGYELVVARDGLEALQLCEQDDREFHLLLTDVIMPKMGGRELSERLHRKRPRLKVLYLSGHAHDAMVHHGTLDSDVDLLEKPFAKAELLKRVREVLNSR